MSLRSEKNSQYVEMLKEWETSGIASETSTVPSSQERPMPVIPFLEVIHPSKSIDATGPTTKKTKCTEFEYYGTTCRVHNVNLKGFRFKTLSSAWETLSNDKYSVVLFDCLKIKEELYLCDWAYIKLVKTYSEAVIPNNPSSGAVLAAYILAQSGFKIRLVKDDNNNYYLLYGVDSDLVDLRYWIIDGTVFSCFEDLSEIPFYVCNGRFPGETPARMDNNSGNFFAVLPSDTRTLVSRSCNLTLNVSSNLNYINFLKDYPEYFKGNDKICSWLNYAAAKLSVDTENILYPALSEATKNMSPAESVNYILHFIQEAFPYKDDIYVSGRQNTFYPQETMYYPFSDCEDRSILFSRIVRDVLKLDVILVYFEEKQHLLAATKIPEYNETGWFFNMEGEMYYVTDPSYLGSNLGDLSENFMDTSFEILKLSD